MGRVLASRPSQNCSPDRRSIRLHMGCPGRTAGGTKAATVSATLRFAGLEDRRLGLEDRRKDCEKDCPSLDIRRMVWGLEERRVWGLEERHVRGLEERRVWGLGLRSRRSISRLDRARSRLRQDRSRSRVLRRDSAGSTTTAFLWTEGKRPRVLAWKDSTRGMSRNETIFRMPPSLLEDLVRRGGGSVDSLADVLPSDSLSNSSSAKGISGRASRSALLPPSRLRRCGDAAPGPLGLWTDGSVMGSEVTRREFGRPGRGEECHVLCPT